MEPFLVKYYPTNVFSLNIAFQNHGENSFTVLDKCHFIEQMLLNNIAEIVTHSFKIYVILISLDEFCSDIWLVCNDGE